MAILSKPTFAVLSTLVLMAIIRRYGALAVHAGNKAGVIIPLAESKAEKREKLGVNAKFVGELFSLLRICVPSLFSPEAGIAVIIAALMVARSEFRGRCG